METPTIAHYSESIVKVFDKKTNNDFTKKPRRIENIAHKYSNTKVPIPRFILDDDIVKKNNSIVIGYECLNCKAVNQITLNLFMRKVKNGIKCCDACKNLDEVKRAEHAAYMLGERVVEESSKKWSEKTLDERLFESHKLFEMEDDEFKKQYFTKHMTCDEFERVKTKIKSIGNGKLKSLENYDYMPNFKIWNQTKFTPILISKDKTIYEKPNYIEWVCESCDNNFINRDLEIQKNSIKILCRTCAFSNKIFKIKSMKSPWGKILYQSVQEHRFIKWCIEKSIKILNGPNIEYTWKDKVHKYRVDFQLPDLKMLIELKDNHVWHKIQIENGKWGAKEECAKKWCEDNGWKYEIIFPKTLATWKENIETCKI
jgi:ribosomal protein L44E/predicted RNA-binding Zn-ribbon protein involved in translation (DUF1610 family)